MKTPPTVSIIIPAYNSQATIAGCLEAIGKQTFRSFEVIVVDSGPTDECARLVRSEFPWVRFDRVPGRLLPHAARNRGVELSSAEIIVFTDPDIYPREDWLARLLEAHERTGEIVVGSVACYGNRWLDLGAHLAKFDLWLPGGPPRTSEIAPTMNLLCPRRVFDELGGFRGEIMIGDTLFGWEAYSHGHSIAFEPKAIVSHHHVTSWGGLLRERASRGSEYGLARIDQSNWGRGRILGHLLVTLVPIRLAGLVARTVRCAARSGMLGAALSTSPIIVTAHSAWLTGEGLAFISALSPAH